MLRYYWRLLRTAFTHAVGPFDLWTGLGSALLGVADHEIPGAGLMTQYGWQIPVWALAAVMLARLLVAPYWLAKTDGEIIAAYEASAQPEAVREALAKLRAAGVILRNQADDAYYSDNEWSKWEGDISAWNECAIQAVRNASKADSIWFSIADVVPPARISMDVPWEDEDRDLLYRIHDFRLVKLEQLILKYGAA